MSHILSAMPIHVSFGSRDPLLQPKPTGDMSIQGVGISIQRYHFTPYDPGLKISTARRMPRGEIISAHDEKVINTNQEAATKSLASSIKDFLLEAGRATKDFLKTSSFVQRFKEDVTCLVRNFAVRSGALGGEKETMKLGFQGRFFGALIASDVMGRWTSIPLSVGLQLATGNPWIGMASHVLISYLASALSFQGFWALQNRGLYKSNEKGPIRAFLDMQKDLIPAHIQAAKLAGKIYCVTLPLYAALTGLTDVLSAQAVPVALLARALLTPAAGILFVKWMGDFHERLASKLAEREFNPDLKGDAPSLNSFGKLLNRIAPRLLKWANVSQ